MQTFYYRIEDSMYDDGNPTTHECAVIRETAKGVVVGAYGREHFVLKGVNGKRFAYPTLDDAITSYKARKRRAILLLTAQLNKQETMLLAINNNQLEKPYVASGIHA